VTEPGEEASLKNIPAGNGQDGPAMRPKSAHAALSSVGEHTTRESESAKCCAAGKERVANAHPHFEPGTARSRVLCFMEQEAAPNRCLRWLGAGIRLVGQCHPPSGFRMSAADLLAGCIRVVCGARLLAQTGLPAGPALYFANHSSHLDFVIIWACLPKQVRDQVQPVAGRDYWEKTALRRWLAHRVFHAVLIERQRVTVASNPMAPMLTALDAGHALIVFPEGTRSPDGDIHEFKPGLFHLARARPAIPLVPILLENLNRMLPKGDFLPVPLIAAVHAGGPLQLIDDETRADFLSRAREAVCRLADPNSS